jgi:hypothetical protein
MTGAISASFALTSFAPVETQAVKQNAQSARIMAIGFLMLIHSLAGIVRIMRESIR